MPSWIRIQKLKLMRINADPDPQPCDKESKSNSKVNFSTLSVLPYAVRKTLANILRFLLSQDALPSPSYTIPPAQLLCQLVTSSSSKPIRADNQLYLLLPPAPEVNEPELAAGSAHTPHHAAHAQLVAGSLLTKDVRVSFTKYRYHSVCHLVGIGTLPTPLSPASVPLPPEPGGGGQSPAGEELGESQFRRLQKKPNTLPTLWFRSTIFMLLYD